MSRQLLISILTAALVGAATSALVAFKLSDKPAPTKQQLIKDFYEIENAVHVSPHTVRKNMDKNQMNFTLVDLRSQQEYEKEHIVGAVNIPAYKDPNTSYALDDDLAQKQRIIDSFKALDWTRDVIVYCYSMPCMTGRKIGKLLADNGIFVKHLNIGWNEWRYYWTMWNHDSETPTEFKDYVISGSASGTPKLKPDAGFSPCREGELGC